MDGDSSTEDNYFFNRRQMDTAYLHQSGSRYAFLRLF